MRSFAMPTVSELRWMETEDGVVFFFFATWFTMLVLLIFWIFTVDFKCYFIPDGCIAVLFLTASIILLDHLRQEVVELL